MACDWLLIDGSSLIFRAFYGVPADSVRAPDGRAVNAVRGFLDNLGRLITERRPPGLVAGHRQVPTRRIEPPSRCRRG
jgi:5'-3' exonuclease